MTDAYRTSALSCPRCPSSPLREFQNRYICDTCNGMLIREDDFVATVHEIDGSNDPLAFHDSTDAGKPCPACARPMTSCKVSIGALRVAEPVLRCEHDGLWLSQNALTATFARVSRRVRTGGGTASPGAYAPMSSGGLTAAMNSIHEAFGGGNAPATAGLAISHWHTTRPRVHTLFVSAYKDRRLGCPSCKEAALAYRGDRWACSTCAGSYVENAALAAMVSDMTNSPWELPVVGGTPGERACPVCKEPMLVEVMEAVTIDRCTAHGVWFDEHELQTALHHVSTAPQSVGGWVKQLFHRHGKIDDRDA